MRGKGIKNYTHSHKPGANYSIWECQQLLESEKQWMRSSLIDQRMMKPESVTGNPIKII